MRLYMRVRLVDINMGNWTTGTRGCGKDIPGRRVARVRLVPANIEGG